MKASRHTRNQGLQQELRQERRAYPTLTEVLERELRIDGEQA